MVNDKVFVMTSEPLPDITIEEIKKWRQSHQTEKELAQIFAVASNKFWWVEDNKYDYEEGTKENIEAIRISN